jgi:alkyl hydroperoxide reductase subunit AhpF
MIAFTLGLFVGSTISVLMMAIFNVSGQKSRLEEAQVSQVKNATGQPHTPAQSELEAFWGGY